MVRFLGAVVQLSVAVDEGGRDLVPIDVDPIRLSAATFRKFASSGGLDAALEELDGRVEAEGRGDGAT